MMHHFLIDERKQLQTVEVHVHRKAFSSRDTCIDSLVM